MWHAHVDCPDSNPAQPAIDVGQQEQAVAAPAVGLRLHPPAGRRGPTPSPKCNQTNPCPGRRTVRGWFVFGVGAGGVLSVALEKCLLLWMGGAWATKAQRHLGPGTYAITSCIMQWPQGRNAEEQPCWSKPRQEGPPSPASDSGQPGALWSRHCYNAYPFLLVVLFMTCVPFGCFYRTINNKPIP